MPNNKIIIAGDSWGVGEWSPQCLNQPLTRSSRSLISHKGLEQYFVEYGYTVVNLSEGGSSNLKSIERLKYHPINTDDIVLWIMSDPLRDLTAFIAFLDNKVNDKASEKITEEFINAQGVYPLLHNLIHNSFNDLNQIGHPVNLIGGLCNINTDISSQYNNLITVIPSWINLLVGHMPEYEYTKNKDFVITSGAVIQNIHLSRLNKNLATSIINDLYGIKKNFAVLKEDIFQPDGVHPNRHGHRILFDKIIEALEIDKNSK